VRAKRPVLNEIAGLSAEAVQRLQAGGILTPEHLVRVEREGTPASRLSDVPKDSLRLAVDHATLSIHKGMGSERAALLARAAQCAASFARLDAARRLADLVCGKAGANGGERPDRPERKEAAA